ncbi:hypothetical protein CBL_10365 [Carabus blaptoides fortunei]
MPLTGRLGYGRPLSGFRGGLKKCPQHKGILKFQRNGQPPPPVVLSYCTVARWYLHFFYPEVVGFTLAKITAHFVEGLCAFWDPFERAIGTPCRLPFWAPACYL